MPSFVKMLIEKAWLVEVNEGVKEESFLWPALS